MWELIRANKRDSVLLITLMAVVLLALGFILGLAIVGPEGGVAGLGIAAVVWLVLTLVSFSSGDQILLAASRAQPITHDVHPQLFNIVEEMKIAADLPPCPKSTSSTIRLPTPLPQAGAPSPPRSRSPPACWADSTGMSSKAWSRTR
jgi:hypothetical protein